MTATPDQLPAHSEYSPSSSEGWSTCADYINANRGLPDTTSWEAAEGTAAHWIRNECLMNGEDAVNYIGHIQKVEEWEFEWTADDARLLQPGIDRIRSYDGLFYGEHWVNLTTWLGTDSQGRPQGGTLDGGIITDDLICVDDEKWGRGVPVSPIRNKQLMLYALGFWESIARHKTQATRFLLRIDQPRHLAGGGEWETNLDELLAFGEWIKERVAATKQPNPPRTASLKGCMWCRRKEATGGCDTYDAYMVETLGLEFDDLDNPPLQIEKPLTPERRRVLLDHSSAIEKWLERLSDECLEDYMAGRPTGGLKAIDGRKSPDAWIDEKTVATPILQGLLGDRSFTSKLITPTQACKNFNLDDFDLLLLAPHIKRGQRKPTLVPEEVDRPALTRANEFDDLDS